jgi:large subunit ribosomal protein L30
MARELTIKQVRSANGANPRQRDTLRTLRLGRIGSRTTRPDSPQLQGLIDRISHLVEIEGAG